VLVSTESISALVELRRVQPSSMFLRGLSGQELHQLAEIASLKVYPARANVFQTGEPTKHFHLLLAGVWKISQEAPNGQFINLAFRFPGHVVGVHSVLGSTTYPFSADVIAPSKVLFWHPPTLSTFMRQTANLTWNVCEILNLALYEFCDRYRELMTENVEQRTAHALIRLVEQLGKRKGPELIIDTPISLEDLAGYAGTTLFTISRILNRWQRGGLLRKNRRLLIVEDLELLKTIADATYARPDTARVASAGSRPR
jgi:CRP/FNR family transcriptional regulator, nitrogen oxide reductase regulator